MTFYIALLAWLLISAVLVTGLVMAVKGSVFLLLAGLLVFVIAFSVWGCATH